MEIYHADNSPIVVIGFNRPEHLRRTLDALAKCIGFKNSKVLIFLDGPRDHIDEALCKKVKSVCEKFSWDKPNVKLKVRNQNLGLAKNITNAITEVISKYKKIIVLEDDLIVSPVFIEFMNLGLQKYEKNSKIWHLSGWSPELPVATEDIYCSEKMFCWGWATWSDKWEYYSKDTNRMISEWNPKAIHQFNYESTANHWNQILFNHLNITNTWAVFWAASIFDNNGLCVNPKKSLVKNIGFDGSGMNFLSGYQKQIDQLVMDIMPNLDLKVLEERKDVRWGLRQFLSGNKTKVEILVMRFLTRNGFYTQLILSVFRFKFLRNIIMKLRS
ncbi:glycosyltransferase [Pseudomonadales bacterium]|nr:glycosyltransferase [Pseudomonadales bacterium]